MDGRDTNRKNAGSESVLTDELIYLFNEGKYYNAYNTFGAHPDEEYILGAGERPAPGIRFTVWAPGVESVRVVGDFNNWDVMGSGDVYDLKELQDSGIWSGFVPGAKAWQLYKYNIGYRVPEDEGSKTSGASSCGKDSDADEGPEIRYFMKADPFAFTAESRPGTASRIADMSYEWHDGEWMADRAEHDTFRSPMNIYEMHIGSWRQHEDGTFLTYVELADILPAYLKDMGYTHVEFLPLMEHPFDSSWGYQVTGYYAPTSRFGSPGDFRYLIDKCHQAGIGVIFDWVPGHFCRDEHGLGKFNGHKLFESGEHPEWGTYKFDFSRPQVRSFLLSNAMYWIDLYHIDGIRVDSVTSMLYMNYGVKDGGRKKYNMFGDERDLDAMEFLKEFNYMVGTRAQGVFTVAEESTAWPHVTAPPDAGGLGFHYKWHMGWMNDTLEYMKTDFQNRQYEHDRLAAQPNSSYNENYVLALSHDEVVHGKKSLISKMPGDLWRQFAGIRLLTMYQMTHPGKKLNFMGHELAEFIEWRDYEGLEWFMLDHENHRKYKDFVRDINHLYLDHPALWDNDSDWRGFRWIDAENNKQQIFTFVRKSLSTGEILIVVLNASAKTYDDYRIGVPEAGMYEELINSDDERYAGSGRINRGFIDAVPEPAHGMPYSIRITMPPLGGCILVRR